MKVKKLIKHMGKGTEEVQNKQHTKEECKACSMFQNRKSVFNISIPKIMKHLQTTTQLCSKSKALHYALRYQTKILKKEKRPLTTF